MAFDWNIFRIIADLSHTLSKCILIWAIHSNKSAEGVSLITQIFYLLVFASRYLPYPLFSDDYMDANKFHYLWNNSLKVFYLVSSAYIIFIMMRMYARTREREKAWKIGAFSLAGSLVAAPFVMMVFEEKKWWGFREFLWVFSIIFESVCVLPQLLLLRQTTVPTVIDSYYLVTLGSYRAFYVANWIVRGVHQKPNNPVSIIFGVIQTILYIDFGWVYYTRQRVKLRGGTVVDSDDLSKGWIVKRLIGRGGDATDEETADEADGQHQGSRQGWGRRGISVSADDTTRESESEHLADPRNFEDQDSDDETPAPKPATTTSVGNGSEWRDEDRS